MVHGVSRESAAAIGIPWWISQAVLSSNPMILAADDQVGSFPASRSSLCTRRYLQLEDGCCLPEYSGARSAAAVLVHESFASGKSHV